MYIYRPQTVIKRRWYRRHREEILEKFRKDRLIVLKHYGGRCACCGIDVPEFLGVDHVFGRTSGTVLDRLKGPTLYAKLIKLNFPEGFQVLCHNCNMAKGLYGKCPHEEMKEVDKLLKELYQQVPSSLTTESEKITETSTNSATV